MFLSLTLYDNILLLKCIFSPIFYLLILFGLCSPYSQIQSAQRTLRKGGPILERRMVFQNTPRIIATGVSCCPRYPCIGKISHDLDHVRRFVTADITWKIEHFSRDFLNFLIPSLYVIRSRWRRHRPKP